ncbi:hypothetical protein EST38_g4413 [Candolleomyces aberdarensis]|uniref:Uncharacterized protein n=1 Tax=Candolleomyces aberdarensis TaxID=2316362 RepID=A0A4Q2DQF3_9AGAR|nr:hypothetical protein EST38_g4413 [Candolleomyces aberdarensis]
MRYCAYADSRLRMVTIAPSEPLLAEAAFEHLHYFCRWEEVLEIIAANLDTWGIHQGDRGEFVMGLIWMAARDAVVVKAFPGNVQNRRPWDPYRHSVVFIMDFMKNLLPTGYHQKLESMKPSVGGGTDEFQHAFADCRLWCNHFIQVQDYKVISTKFLCALLSNGIGVLCAPNQAGIDLLWIGLKGDKICEENLVLILGQAKNDKSYRTKSNPLILDAMDPVKLDICAANRSIPIIRIVFALASENPGVTLVEPSDRKSLRQKQSSKFTSYDFWFAGVDPSTFQCVTDKEAGYYRDLLASSRPIYNPPFPVPRDLGDLTRLVGLKNETEGTGEARVNMRRAANTMMMATKPHFPDTWHALLFKGKD